jgi:pepF/M3 family oligoendopeptidase
MMNIERIKKWDLTAFYKGFDETYESDINKLDELINSYVELIQKRETYTDKNLLESYLKLQEQLSINARTLSSYASLIYATDVSNQDAPKYLSRLQRIFRKSTKEDVLFTRYLETLDLDKLAEESQLIKQYIYNLKRIQEDAKHLLSESEEVMYAKLRELSSSAWGQLQGLMTANLDVDYRDQKITLSEVRNLAYEADQSVRKDAYEAELKASATVDDAVALALSNIKREVTVMDELRGYESTLHKTLKQSKMTKETLNAMIEAMMDARPHFEAYLKAKAEYLGHQNGLPFYDLFAPVGKLEQTFTYEEAQTLIVEAFGSYSDALANYATKAFNGNWIDVYPKKGKRGGAFCSNQPQLKQSRIMLNFTGSLSDVLTLAHELGHGYHGEIISNNAPLHWSYPMPLAETASIFCETIVNHHLLSKIEIKKERLSILENALQGDTQVIIDILSRFFFESEVFSKTQGPISKHEFKKMMTDAQIKAYGQGLDHDFLNPYMWLNKPHYYSAGLNFYNFPYAFGLLFGKGLYAQYLKDKTTFINRYDDLLKETTRNDVEVVAKTMQIDVTDLSFWKDSLAIIIADIKETIELFKQ